jgi:hypothetical protein
MRPVLSQAQEQTTSSYSDLLLSTILSIRFGSKAGFKLIDYPITGLPIPSFYPREGLDEPNAVPFLIDTMMNGPDWTDQEILTTDGGLYPYIARCYSALCLGSIGDERAFEPLLEIMKNSDLIKDQYNLTSSDLEKHNISDYAAIALGYLGDENAVEPLINALIEKDIDKAIDALTMLRDIRAIEPIITYASEYNILDVRIHYCLEHISRATLYSTYSFTNRTYSSPDFPELGECQPDEFYQKLWQYWLIQGNLFAKQEFEENYIKWKIIKEERPDEQGAQNSRLRKMVRGGIPALPYIISGIKKGDESLTSAVKELFYPQPDTERLSEKYPPIEPNATECLRWWEQNKQYWLIFTPIPETLNVPLDYPNIQAAIDNANNNDTVLVADGTYTGNGNRDIDFKGKAITVKSQNGPETCIINCQGTFSEPHRGFYFHNNEDENSILQGFTITNGYSLSGGGIYCFMCSPKIVDCIITKSISDYGGGIETSSSKSTINDCIISNNYAYISGGGIFTTFRPDINIDGPFYNNCIISGNRSNEYGGGIVCSRSSTLINCTIFGNMASGGGGGIYIIGISDDVVNLHNCILWGNTTSTGNGNQIYSYTSTRGYVTIKANYCSIQNNLHDLSIHSGYMLGNWISEDPNFVKPGYWDMNDTSEIWSDDYWIEGDYHLKSQAGRFDPNSQTWVQDTVTSPCIDAGDPNSPIGLEPFPNGGYINMGAYGGTSEASKSYFGKPVCEIIVAGDINGDCKVDELDLEIMMLHWLEEN